MSLTPGEWASGLCSCCAAGIPVCFCATFCTPCQYGNNASALAAKVPGSGGNCCLSGLVYCLLSGCGLCCCVHTKLRAQIRATNNIQSGNDCLITTCFPCCAIIQEANLIQRLPSK